MIRLDLDPSALISEANQAEPCPGRLLVLVPADATDNAETRRIWDLAHKTGRQVELVGLYKDSAEEPLMRRALVTMASLLQHGKICAEIKMFMGTSWVEALNETYEPGDAIVCFAEQRTGRLQRSLSHILESNFKATVYILSSFSTQNPPSSTLSPVSAWVGFMAIIVGFGLLQANIVRLPEGWMQSLLLVLSTIPEFWLISLWQGRFE